MSVGADDNRLLNECRRGGHFLAIELVRLQELEFPARPENVAFPCLVDQIKAPCGVDGGCHEFAAQVLVPQDLAACCVRTADRAGIRHPIELVPHQNRRRDGRHPTLALPRDICVAHIPISVMLDSPEVVTGKSCAVDHQAVADGGLGGDGESLAVVATPEFPAGRRIVGDQPLGPGNNHLDPAPRVDEDRSGKGLVHIGPAAGQGGTLGLPGLLAGLLVERRHVLGITAVPHQDQEILVYRRGAPGPHLMVERQLFLPNDRAGLAFEAGRAIGPKITVEVFPVGNRGWGGKAVEGVNGGGILNFEEGLFPEEFPIVEPVSQDLDRDVVGGDARVTAHLLLAGVFLDGRRQVDASVADDRGGMSPGRDGGLPLEVGGLAPFQGRIGIRRNPVAFGPANLGPGGWRRGNNTRDERSEAQHCQRDQPGGPSRACEFIGSPASIACHSTFLLNGFRIHCNNTIARAGHSNGQTCLVGMRNTRPNYNRPGPSGRTLLPRMARG